MIISKRRADRQLSKKCGSLAIILALPCVLNNDRYAEIIMNVQISLGQGLNSLGYKLRSGVLGSYSVILIFFLFSLLFVLFLLFLLLLLFLYLLLIFSLETLILAIPP